MTIATHSTKFGAGGLGLKASRGFKRPTLRADKAVPHPVYGRHRMTTRRELHADGMKKKAEDRERERHWEKIATERLAEKNAKTRGAWATHLKERSVSRTLKW